MRQIFKKVIENSREVFACFVDLNKAFNRVQKVDITRLLEEFGVHIARNQTGLQSYKPFVHLGAGLCPEGSEIENEAMPS